MKKLHKKLTVILTIMLLLVTATCQSLVSAGSAYAAVAKVESEKSVAYGVTRTSKFTVNGHTAFCANHQAPTPPKGTSITSITTETNANVRKALYYGYGGPAATLSGDSGFVKTASAVSNSLGHSMGQDSFYKKLKNYAPAPSSFTVYYCKTKGSYQNLVYGVYSPKTSISGKKTSTDSSALAENGYSLAGAKYGVYTSKANANADKNRQATLTTKKDGTTNKATLNLGTSSPGASKTFYLKEVSAPTGFKLDTTVYSVSAKDQDSKVVTFKEVPKKGKLQLEKSSAEPSYTNGNSAYSLAGAKYGVYSDKALTKKVGTLTTDENGKSNVLSVYAGTYYVKEEVEPAGFKLDENIHTVVVDINKLSTTKILSVKDEPKADPPAILVRKVDKDTGKPVALGDGSLAGAQFTVKYYEGTEYSGDPEEAGADPERTWVLKTDESGFAYLDKDHFVSGNEFYPGPAGNPTIPVGTITIEETKAPKGYEPVKETFVRVITGDEPIDEVCADVVAKEPVIRGDIEIMKTDEDTGKALAGVKFNVIDKSENEVVAELVTDENGYATTASEEYPNGTLPYGEYIVREVEPVTGYAVIDDIPVTVDTNKQTIKLDIENKPAKIGTTATCQESDGNKAFPMEKATIIDTVEYENLVAGNEYTIKGKLMDKETGKALLINGNEVTAEETFEAKTPSGSIDLTFTLNAKDLAGKDTVVFEDLYLDDVKIATHSDINDEGQTISFLNPKIGTTATCEETDSHFGIAKDNVTITDTIEYSGLIPGEEYKMVGYLVDKETGEVLGEEGEDPGTYKEVTFTPESSEGSVRVTFTVDAKDLKDKSLVVFEELFAYGGDFKITEHTDLNDSDQTVTFINPKIGTTALADDTNLHLTEAKGEVTITDTIRYEGVAAGIEYTAAGTLYDKATGKPVLVNGKEVTSSVTFTAEKSEGEVKVEFKLDASELKNTSVVAFEKLYYNDTELTNHEDINDENQTVNFPELGTTLTDVVTQNHIGNAGDKTRLVDIVSYKNLIPGLKYEITGTLMDSETGEPLLVDGKEITSTVKFTPDKANGSEEVVFTFDSTQLESKTVVAFEKLLVDSHVVARHTDIEDEDQSVTFPEIGTTAIDSDTNKHISFADDKVTVIDTVSYEGLIPGEEYTVKGILMDKKTGSNLYSENKTVIAETTFTAEESSGEVEVTFTFNASDLAGHTAVAFEELYFNDHLIAKHKDIEDEDQSVAFPELKTEAVDKATGKHIITFEEGKTVVITDTVKYENLVAGEKYTVKGKLMDKATGKAVKVNGKEITAEKEFTVKNVDGEVKVDFNVNMNAVRNKDVVVYEYLYVHTKDDSGNEELEIVGSHEDINDKDQSVEFASVVKTGDTIPVMIIIAAMFMMIAAVATVVTMRRRQC